MAALSARKLVSSSVAVLMSLTVIALGTAAQVMKLTYSSAMLCLFSWTGKGCRDRKSAALSVPAL